MVRSKDQMAATAIAPAPINRTSLRQMPLTKLARSPCIGVIAVMRGTAPAQAIRMPSSMARPTEIPTRWPAPTSAREKEKL